MKGLFYLCAIAPPDYNGRMKLAGDTILLVERPGKPDQTFDTALHTKGFAVKAVPTGAVALDWLCTSRPALIILNAASLGSSGVRICHQLRQQAEDVPIIHILPEGKQGEGIPGEGVANITLIMPFTARKLINRIKRLLPAKYHDVIQVGPIRLAPAAQMVEVDGRERRLTAKTASLLEVFLKHPGQVLDRGFLMRQVWKTDYVGDTRTLDVHVRWVREAIEVEPHLPRHILTIRGRGYRFEPGEKKKNTDSS
ncbi:MAG: response regulator transcription factor [Anaerolineae bacterium]|nr:response regulator transcription factor [Anaerolineae bacterium]